MQMQSVHFCPMSMWLHVILISLAGGGGWCNESAANYFGACALWVCHAWGGPSSRGRALAEKFCASFANHQTWLYSTIVSNQLYLLKLTRSLSLILGHICHIFTSRCSYCTRRSVLIWTMQLWSGTRQKNVSWAHVLFLSGCQRASACSRSKYSLATNAGVSTNWTFKTNSTI